MNKKEQPEIQSLNDRSWNVLAEMWQNQEAEKAQELLEDENLTAEMDAFFAEHDAQYRSQINSYFNQKKHRRTARHFSRAVQRIAACLVLFIVLGGAVLAVGKTVEIYFGRLRVEDHGEYTNLDIRPQRDALDVGVEHGLPIAEAQEGELDVPEGWEGTYFPSIIPEDLVVSDVMAVSSENTVSYSLDGENLWRFMYSEISDVHMNIDSENCEKRTIIINDCEGTILSKQDYVTIYWYDGKTLFMFEARGYSVEEVLIYAQSLRKIKQ